MALNKENRAYVAGLLEEWQHENLARLNERRVKLLRELFISNLHVKRARAEGSQKRLLSHQQTASIRRALLKGVRALILEKEGRA